MTALRVLLVDDERDFVDTLRMRLDTRGVEAECVYSADEALAWLTERGGELPVDVVVLDLRMPGMSGLEAMELVQARWPKVGRIMLTGHGAEDVAASVARLGGHYLSKPVDIARLVDTLRIAGLGSRTGDAAP